MKRGRFGEQPIIASVERKRRHNSPLTLRRLLETDLSGEERLCMGARATCAPVPGSLTTGKIQGNSTESAGILRLEWRIPALRR